MSQSHRSLAGRGAPVRLDHRDELLDGPPLPHGPRELVEQGLPPPHERGRLDKAKPREKRLCEGVHKRRAQHDLPVQLLKEGVPQRSATKLLILGHQARRLDHSLLLQLLGRQPVRQRRLKGVRGAVRPRPRLGQVDVARRLTRGDQEGLAGRRVVDLGEGDAAHVRGEEPPRLAVAPPLGGVGLLRELVVDERPVDAAREEGHHDVEHEGEVRVGAQPLVEGGGEEARREDYDEGRQPRKLRRLDPLQHQPLHRDPELLVGLLDAGEGGEAVHRVVAHSEVVRVPLDELLPFLELPERLGRHPLPRAHQLHPLERRHDVGVVQDDRGLGRGGGRALLLEHLLQGLRLLPDEERGHHGVELLEVND
mmetsp:Transcript_22030/g.51270  ORF Transcript_22030/g.51270 Transcript_22030/m.51270 type:complete len:366 (-) Transcript_22030:729-1826(-)